MVLPDILNTIFVVLHVIFAVIAAGAVAVTDYLHIVGLRSKSIEKKLLFVYPILGKFITTGLAGLILTGLLILINKPELISNQLFQLKIFFVVIVAVNGAILHFYVFPAMQKCSEDGRKSCSQRVLLSSAVAGSISVVTWFSIIVLALTKNMGYSVWQFVLFYSSAVILAFTVSLLMELKARKWDNRKKK